jgi:MtfA peptidase
VVSDDSVALAGEAHHHHGPLVLSWGAVRRETRQFGTGYNVVVHEFAHKLDMADGVVNGSPPIADASLRARWEQVCRGEFEILRAGTSPHVLRDYAATDPGEFFAVAAEAYFDQPSDLAAHHRHLYAVLDDYFHPH